MIEGLIRMSEEVWEGRAPKCRWAYGLRASFTALPRIGEVIQVAVGDGVVGGKVIAIHHRIVDGMQCINVIVDTLREGLGVTQWPARRRQLECIGAFDFESFSP